MLKKALAAWIIAGCLSMVQASGSPVPSLDVPAMENASDLIVTGRIFPEAGDTEMDPAINRYNVAVYSVLKGDLRKKNLEIRIRLPLEGVNIETGNGSRGIFFLKRVSDGVYTNADPAYYFLFDSPGVSQTDQEDASSLSKIARELAHVLATAPEAFVADRPELQSRIGKTIELSEDSVFLETVDGRAPRKIRIPVTAGIAAEGVYENAVETLRSMPSAVTAPALREALDARLGIWNQLWVVAALTESGDLSHLHDISQAVASPNKKLLPAIFELEFALRGIASRYEQWLSPDLTPVLTELLSSTVPGIRRATASALPSLRGEAGIKPLAQIALQDQDLEVRFFAETGLCRITHRFEPPCGLPIGVNGYQPNEAIYHKYWSDWAAANLQRP